MSNELKVSIGEDGIPFIQLGQEQLRLDLEDLDDEYKKIAESELRETPENVQEAVEKLRELIRAEENLSIPLDDETFLYKFLRPCKFYAESAFVRMKNFYKFKLKHEKMCSNLLPSNEQNVFKQGIITFMPKRDRFKRRIMIIQSGYKWKPKQCSLEEIFKAVMLALEAAMYEPRTQVTGAVVILDMEGLSLSHVYQFSPQFAKMVLDWVQECVPLRLKGVHIINQPFIFNMLYAIFKPFLREKLRNRVYFHGKQRAQLVEYIGPESVPAAIGGKLEIPEIPGLVLYDILCEYEEEYKACNEIGYMNCISVK
ncbi:alpha-tocopherol transfer protein-like [Chrysoperla carnea]|uniref:alpha-tocopherol transfer protein-like n=1 Tax=Chrysoperla carnea TaxID=189513 RepID=UPI001D05F348|nr:alpha-tocopherol transfer protein-like [Chrysoperla carnea]